MEPYLDKVLHVHHYMDDILIWGNSSTSSSSLKDQLIPSLSSLGFKVAPHNIQLTLPITFLGTEITYHSMPAKTKSYLSSKI